ncbi:Serine/threonine protein kinase [Handroanthus impetiginosus]|uniref:Serine/threonine protein kinase n=1 Tax=Handroanthus impetiginosus TaxID=429701 RepID=A0A2G9IBQ5_9LAMI|nr:Serine/threonine protein kinase [Handroanthus impetiginosus]
MMLFYTLYLFLLLHILPATTAAAAGPAYTATDFILLNCGASSNMNDSSGRSWDGDERTRYAPPNAAAISSTSTASSQDPSVFQVPYWTARVFRSTFSYSFPVLAGPKFLRLYFYPTTYSDFNASQSFFSVTANRFQLLSNFSAILYSQNYSEPSFMKEFIINVQENQILNLTFSPNANSFAFINGIEIVSMPDHLYFPGNDEQITSGNQVFYLKDDTALEKLYRLNVGGTDVLIQADSGPTRGMFRAWSQDDDYIFGGDSSFTPHAEDHPIKYTNKTPPYSGPEIVYQTSRVMGNTSRSLEWAFPVDSGFSYLLKFHFCEIQLEVTKQNERVFDIFVDKQQVDIQVDVIFWTGGTQIPIFRDYVVWVPDDGRRGKKDLRLSLSPNTLGHPKYNNALLNGLEIFKLSDDNRSLAAANPETGISSPPALKVPGNKKNKWSSVIYPVIGSLIGVLALVTAVSFLILRRRRKIKDSLSTSGTKSSWVPLSIASRSTTRTNGSSLPLPSDLCRHFSLDEIKTATANFNDNFVIGKGGFGNVYRGFIDNGASTVAIKRLNPSSNQGAREFLTEIEMLSKLRHLHLVSLIGYCDENGEMILVYDYMAHGTLRDHLYNSDNSPLKWKERLQICIGAAKGLHYLHTSAKHSIIHRDVKSTNILLDEKWVAKVSDFGLSKIGPTGGTHTHVSTVVKGSIGYVDPEYYRRQQLTDKSDVYSFGVVLFEVLCARPAVIPSFPREQVSLAEWGKFCYRKGTIEQIIDSNLEGQIAPECLSKFVETAVMCLGEKGDQRPAMSDVVWSLEFAMQLQEEAEYRGHGAVDGGEKFVLMSSSYPLLARGEPNTTDEEIFSGNSEGASRSKSSGFSSVSSGKLTSGEVFSELMNPTGR